MLSNIAILGLVIVLIISLKDIRKAVKREK